MGQPTLALVPRSLKEVADDLETLAYDAGRVAEITKVAEDLRHGYATCDTKAQADILTTVLHERAASDAQEITKRLGVLAAELRAVADPKAVA
jgi:hypothetical protein